MVKDRTSNLVPDRRRHKPQSQQAAHRSLRDAVWARATAGVMRRLKSRRLRAEICVLSLMGQTFGYQ
ncbi:hypothetical protein KIN20_007628 [Parelaphostrongylus tenuis]|uniref:Uncharacterized protein n=1 Tax=Parelaphostrongylus tenuis TaxID=148309 RepID=A0AAD5MPW9_PARTN|nr:hypothetical protein KIN20_007628 [Parelaphostrongylus tenuis]